MSSTAAAPTSTTTPVVSPAQTGPAASAATGEGEAGAPTARRGPRYVADGGMETDLVFHHGVDLPDFAAFPLLDAPEGRYLLTDYYTGYARVAERAGAGLSLESPTWRASGDWGARLGYDAAALAAVNRHAIDLLHDLAARFAPDVAGVRVVGMIGPRGDGYAVSAAMSAPEAADYHRPQVEAFTAAGVDQVTAYTLGYVAEAVGIVLAARSVGVPIAVSFTVETDGRLPDGTPLADAVEAVDAAAAPSSYLLNCAHPEHMAAGLEPRIAARVSGVRYNSSRLSHAELDEATQLDEGDLADLAAAHARLAPLLPALDVLGGCCGTDARHVAALWGV